MTNATQITEPKPEMRRTWIKVGIVVAALGLIAVIGGGIGLLISRGISSLDPIAEARTPGTATFNAEDKSYDVLLVTGRREPGGSPEDITCEVTLADGRTVSLDGSAQSSSSEVANTESIGSFDAVPGQTSVYCEASATTGNKFVIDSDGLLDRIATLALIGGVVLLVIGAGLILGGVFWKKQPAAHQAG